MNIRLFSHRRITMIFTFLGLLSFLLFTNPNKLPLPLLVVPFFGLFVVLYIFNRWLWRHYSKRKQLIFAAVGSSTPVLLLVFQSIHQLTIRDVLIVLGLVMMTAFYLSKADFIK